MTNQKIIQEFREKFQFLFVKYIKITIGDDGEIIESFLLSTLQSKDQEKEKALK